MKNLSLYLLLLLAFTACQQPKSKQLADPWADYRKGYNWLSKNQDSAFFYFNRSATNATDKFQVALAYQNMAFIQVDAGDNYGAQESLTLSLKSLDEHNPKHQSYLATDYNQLGMTFSNLNDHKRAIDYYKIALQYTEDSQLKQYFLNNQGNSYKDLKKFSDAIESYRAALKIVGYEGLSYARVITNLASTKWLLDKRYDPGPELRGALRIRLHENDLPGQNSSYAHLTDYYTESRPDSALMYALQMLAAANKLHNADDQLYALGKLISLTPGLEAKAYFLQYQRTSDSVQARRNVARNQFAVIRYEVEKAKAETLDLLQKNSERRYQLIAVITLSLLGAIVGIWFYRRRKQRLQIEAERNIQDSKLRLSQIVHDKVANGIYRTMSEVEHQPDMDRMSLLDQLEKIYDVSRNIAHDEPELAIDFTERINTMLYAFKKPMTRLAVTGNEPELWEKAGWEVKEQLSLVLQELMVNMSKHSRATQAHVDFSAVDDSLYIEYQDDGIGLGEKQKKGKGMSGTVSRIEALHGSISFGAGEVKGLHVSIRLPITH
ncbi:tetratricopeptide repeat-containing sensor histidine kinase [Mucilaginibacter celer]|uniref:ATP-binding protein n=1 Tax=Mucilaginibacter celer TaxID=2305508 RepID=A0A494VHN2_9SPHI|nr:tetratricopeptide repeat protein [Mucilaginibacter celer]AYL94246.1 ATP-binding protein [Mucilaginibacter celer]